MNWPGAPFPAPGLPGFPGSPSLFSSPLFPLLQCFPPYSESVGRSAEGSGGECPEAIFPRHGALQVWTVSMRRHSQAEREASAGQGSVPLPHSTSLAPPSALGSPTASVEMDSPRSPAGGLLRDAGIRDMETELNSLCLNAIQITFATDPQRLKSRASKSYAMSAVGVGKSQKS